MDWDGLRWSRCFAAISLRSLTTHEFNSNIHAKEKRLIWLSQMKKAEE
jgi:hypothetical protein